MNFLDCFRQCFKLFTALRSSCSWIFWNFQKKYSRKTAWWSLGLLMLQRAQSNNYDGAFLGKYLTGKGHLLFSPKISILDVWLSYKYAFVAGLNSYKDIFQPCIDANPYYFSPVHLFAMFLRLLLGRSCFI